MNQSLPNAAGPVNLDTRIPIAGMTVDVVAVEREFKGRVAYYRQNVRDYISSNPQSVTGLAELKDAIQKVHPMKVEKYMIFAIDEIIDKMVGKELLSFSSVPIPSEFETELIEKAAKKYVEYFSES